MIMTDKPAKFLMNTWYAAALSIDVSDQLMHRRLLDIPVLLYRKDDGSPVALQDKCPHRFAPLSLGKKQGDNVVCPYHGLTFNGEGQCVHNPHGRGHIPAKAQIVTYPLLEKYGFIWIWMGEEPADESQLPDYSQLDNGHPNALAHTYMRRPCHYELITDNVMDLSHVDHLHGEIITTRGQLSPQMPRVVENEGEISVRWEWRQTPAMMIFNEFLPKPNEEAAQFVVVTWSKPSHIQLTIGATQDSPTDKPLCYDNTIGQYDLHTCTPESENSTHYFFATRRNHNVEDGEFNQAKIAGMHGAFEDEDGPILDRVQKLMPNNDFLSLDPVLISSDAGPIRVRRVLKAAIKVEQSKDKEAMA